MTVADKNYLERTLKDLKANPGLTDSIRARLLRREATKLGSPTDQEVDDFLTKNVMPLR